MFRSGYGLNSNVIKYSAVVLFSTKKGNNKPSNSEFFQMIKSKKVVSAFKYVENMKKDGIKVTPKIYEAVFSLLDKKFHLDKATRLFDEFVAEHKTPTEPCYLALIRCYCDAGEIGNHLNF
jgi:hypothetical protein